MNTTITVQVQGLRVGRQLALGIKPTGASLGVFTLNFYAR